MSALAALIAVSVLAPTAPADTMSLSLSHQALQGQTTQILYSATSQAEGFVTLAVADSGAPCGSTPEQDAGVALLEPEPLTPAQTGAFTGSVNFTPNAAGAFLVCGWVTGRGEYENTTGGPMIASASLPVVVHPAPMRAKTHACRAQWLGRYIATVHARGITCAQAHRVVDAVEHTPLPADVARTPYFKYSPPYTVSTPAGRLICRFEPYGLAGTEHNIRCTRSRVLVRWSTAQE
ncbi:MAG TPA: hypothetical protein VGL37_05065 [Solirubrobacteraceae bacterium]